MDIGILNILPSNLAEMEMLNAPFSERTYKYIALISFINIVLKDIPKFIIQVSDFFDYF